MLQKSDVTFVNSVTLTIKAMTPMQRHFLRGLCERYIPSFSLIAINLLKLLHGNGCLPADGQWMDIGWTDGWTDRWTNGQKNRQIDSA